MNFFDRIRGRGVILQQATNRPAPSQSIIDKLIFQQQLIRTRQDAGKWRDALRFAENPQNPQRDQLYTIYADVVLDLHLQSVMNQRQKSVSKLGFKIVNDQNEEDEDATNLFKSKWFNTYQKLILSTPYFGTTVIQLTGVVNDKFQGPNNTPGVRLINRRLYFPERQIIRDSPQSMAGMRWTGDNFRDWVIAEGDPDDLGLLNGITPLTLMKKGLVQFWAEYAELFGQPTRILKTAKHDTTEREELREMLERMGSLNFAILGMDDVMEFLETRQEDAHEVYEQFLKYVDGSNSKVILGQTMTTDDGSSLSQAEVHSRVLEMFTMDDMIMLSNNVNDELIPRMIRHGFKIKPNSFRIDNKEVLSIEDQMKIDIELLNSGMFKLSAEYFVDKYGTKVEEIDPTTLDDQGVESVRRLLSFYQSPV